MWEKLKNMKNKKETMLIIFLSGILIFVILLPVEAPSVKNGRKMKSSASYQTNSSNNQNTQTDNNVQFLNTCEYNIREYKKSLEKELEEFLSGVEGVGEVRVLIHMKASWKYEIEKDTPVSNSKSGDKSEETRNEATVYTVNEYGQDIPFVSRIVSPVINGVAVAAEGAENESVRLRLVQLIMALYGLDANKVEVIPMK